MTHLQLGLVEKQMPVCMNYDQTTKFQHYLNNHRND